MPVPQGARGIRTIIQRLGLNIPVQPISPPRMFWWEADRRLPRIFDPKLRSQATLTSYGFPSTWSTLQMTPALPDLTTALARNTQPVIQPFSNRASALQIPPAFVPVPNTGASPGRQGI